MSDHDPSYAPKLVALLRRAAPSPRVFVDAGACRGDFTAMLDAHFPDAEIHAFEPDPVQSRHVRERFADTPRIHVWNAALYSHNHGAELRVHADPGTSSLLERPDGARRYFHSSDRVVASIPVPTLTLDDFLAAHAPSGVALLKLDTQGSELAIMGAARAALETSAIDAIYTEFFLVPHYAGAPLLCDLVNYLGEFRYSLFDLFKGPNAANGQLRFGDAIFVSPSFRARYLDGCGDEA